MKKSNSSEKLAAVRQKLANLTEEEKQKLIENAVIVTVDGHVLSTGNILLVAAQNPQATVIAGYRQWQAAGRQVMKGQTGLVIWVPSKRKTEVNGQTEEEKYFIPTTVFDVSQTEAC